MQHMREKFQERIKKVSPGTHTNQIYINTTEAEYYEKKCVSIDMM